jgi:hypothetical protein
MRRASRIAAEGVGAKIHEARLRLAAVVFSHTGWGNFPNGLSCEWRHAADVAQIPETTCI